MRRALPWRCRGNRDGVGGVMKSDRPVIKCHLVPALTALQSIRKKGGRRQRGRERRTEKQANGEMEEEGIERDRPGVLAAGQTGLR